MHTTQPLTERDRTIARAEFQKLSSTAPKQRTSYGHPATELRPGRVQGDSYHRDATSGTSDSLTDKVSSNRCSVDEGVQRERDGSRFLR